MPLFMINFLGSQPAIRLTRNHIHISSNTAGSKTITFLTISPICQDLMMNYQFP